MSDDDKSSRTEEASETKVREAIEKGNVPASREVPVFAALLGMLAIATVLLPRGAAPAASQLGVLLDRAGTIRLQTAADVAHLSAGAAMAAGVFLLPLLTLLAAGGLIASAAQGPFRFVGSRITPQASRVSPREGLKRLLGMRGAVEFARSLAKVVGLGAVVLFVLRADTGRILGAMHTEPATLPGQALMIASHLLAAVAVAMGGAVVLDIAWSRRRWRADLRMTRQEVKDEHKQAEGDPLVKARLRSIALDRARRRMMGNVPRATLVVTNPTHFAVALRYSRAEGGAPVVVAKGQDLLALRIREIARENAIPIVENKPLARALYDQVAVDRMIPAEFYRAVAEILNMLSRRKGAFAP